MSRSELEPIDPREAYEMYLEECRGELSPNTIQAREYRLGYFIRWCEGADNGDEPRLENLNEITGRDFHRFKNWRKDGINKVTLRTQLSDLRQFMKFCVQIDAVDPSIPEKIGVPVLEHGENERDTFMTHDEATVILEYLETYEYASLEHVLFMLLWETGARISGLHSLDVDDVDFEEERLSFHHRPDQGTRLKNGPDGERTVALTTRTVETLRDYVDVNRFSLKDDHGRKPLFSSRHGRMHKNQLPKRIYRLTCPCEHGQACPSGKDPLDCEYEGSNAAAIECPHNTRPHDIRRGSITHWLKQDVPEKMVGDRMNVSTKTLDRHYDKRTEEEKAEQRREYLDDV